MRVLRLQAENVKRIKVIDITPDRHVVRITGANESGKTSVLDCLPFALNGLRAVCDVPLRVGTDSGFIKLDLGENGVVQFQVTRTFNEGGTSSLEVLSGEGAAYKSPQKVVGDFLSALSVDPHLFVRMPRDEQVKVLGDLIGITDGLNAIADARKEAFDTRTDVNRTIKQVKADLTTVERAVQDEHAQRVDVAELMQRLDAVQQSAIDHARLVELHRMADTACIAAEKRIADLEENILYARAVLANEEDTYHKTMADLGKSTYDPMTDEVSNIRARMLNAERINADVAARQVRDQTREKLYALTVRAETLGDSLAEYDAAQVELVSSAKMPLAGLSFGEHGVLYDGIPLDQSSPSRQIRISATMAIALNKSPTALRALRVQDVSLLDEVSLQELIDVAVEHDYQVWLEEVDRTGTVGFVMVDGVGHVAHTSNEAPRAEDA